MSYQNHYLSITSRLSHILARSVWVDRGFGRVFRGEHAGQQVAVKVVDKSHNDVRALLFSLRNTNRSGKSTLIKAIRREALTWRSLSHCFILPFLGIYEEKFQLSLVSPFMVNGTLTKWREQCTPEIAEINTLVRRQELSEQ
jgi:serine/threonine protein kinase